MCVECDVLMTSEDDNVCPPNEIGRLLDIFSGYSQKDFVGEYYFWWDGDFSKDSIWVCMFAEEKGDLHADDVTEICCVWYILLSIFRMADRDFFLNDAHEDFLMKMFWVYFSQDV